MIKNFSLIDGDFFDFVIELGDCFDIRVIVTNDDSEEMEAFKESWTHEAFVGVFDFVNNKFSQGIT
jgi:hypothetical protein